MKDLLALRTRTHPRRVALVAGDRAWTYAELDAAASRVAGGLPASARVATAMPTSAEHVLALHGAWRAGATVVPLDPRSPDRAALAAQAGAPVVAALHEGEPLARPAADLAALVATSGTTGAPRLVRLTRRNLVASAAGSAERLGTTRHDRWLLALPLHHVGGLSVLVRAALAGACVVVGDDIERATVASLVPTQLHRLVEAGRPPPPGLRTVLLGGAPAPASLLARARELGWPVLPTYGLTEAASQVATRARGDARDDAVGPPLARTRVRIVEGRIEVAGPTVAEGYEGGPTFRGRFLTGDLGRLTPDGRVAILGRADDVIVTGGEKVAPHIVEDALLAHPAVAEACVVGVPDVAWGARVVAAVVLRAPADDLVAFVASRLPPFARPKEVRVLDALPRGGSGKVLRREVAALFQTVAT